jgi:hypothetical protein
MEISDILSWIWLLGCFPAFYVMLMKSAKEADEMADFLILTLFFGIWCVPLWPIIAPFWGIGRALGVGKDDYDD